jgi:preprotein translocase subunit YajC
MMNLKAFNVLLAQAGQAAAPAAETAGQAQAPNPTGEMIKMIGMLAIFGLMMYFMIFRPQQKKQKDHDSMLKALKEGDKVMTTSGILGVVISIKERSVTLRSADTKMEVVKSAIAEVLNDSSKS